MHARLVPEMTITPTSCMACRTSNGPAVDLGFDFHSGQIERGRAYLCRDCARQVGLLAGMFEPALVEARDRDIELLGSEVGRLTRELDRAARKRPLSVAGLRRLIREEIRSEEASEETPEPVPVQTAVKPPVVKAKKEKAGV